MHQSEEYKNELAESCNKAAQSLFQSLLKTFEEDEEKIPKIGGILTAALVLYALYAIEEEKYPQYVKLITRVLSTSLEKIKVKVQND